MTWLKALASTSTLTAANTSAIGTKISSTVSAKKNGMIRVCIKDFIKTLVKKGRANTCGLMATGISVSGVRICLTAKDFSFGMISDFTLVTGKTT